MPADRPSDTTDAPDDARDRDTAAAVIADEQRDDTPGSGGLGGLAAARGSPDAARADEATSRNSPIDPPTPHGGAAHAEDEAKALSLGDTPEPHPSSL